MKRVFRIISLRLLFAKQSKFLLDGISRLELSRSLKKYDIHFIVLIAGLLRFFRIGSQSLWHDEIKSYIYANESSLSNLATSVFKFNSIPPLYHVLLRGWISISQSEAWQRSISAIAGIISVIVIFYLVRFLFDRRIALLSSFLMAISPFHIYYSQESGSYSLFLLFSLASLLFLLYAIHFDSKKYWLVFVTATTFACLTHSIAIQLVIIEFLVGVFLLHSDFSWKKCRNLSLSFISIALLSLPFYIWQLGLLTESMNARQSIFRESNWFFELSYSLYSFVVGYGLGPSLRALHNIESINTLSGWIFEISLVAIVFTIIMLQALKSLNYGKLKQWILFIWFLTPLTISLFISRLMNVSFNVRYAMFAFPALIVLVAIGFNGFSRSSLKLFFLGVVMVLNLSSVFNQHFNEKYFKENTMAAGEYLSKFADENDLILVNASYMAHDISYYFRGEADVVGFPVHSESLYDEKKLKNELSRLMKEKHSRIWLVLTRTFDGDKYNRLSNFFNKEYTLIESEQWTGVNIFAYN